MATVGQSRAASGEQLTGCKLFLKGPENKYFRLVSQISSRLQKVLYSI